MPRYYFHLFNDETSIDEEGQVLSNDSVALQHGQESARAMAADSVSRGHLVLDHRIQVQNEAHETVATVYFRDVVTIREHA